MPVSSCDPDNISLLLVEMRRGSAKGIVTSCDVDELERCEQWQLADPHDMTTGVRLQHSNSESSLSDDDDIRKRKLQTSPPRVKRKKRRTS